jgi:radical SAM-linked protein
LRKSDIPGNEIDTPGNTVPDPDQVVRKVRIVFSKTGDMRFLGHLEIVRVVERACRRAGIPVAFSGGYSPKPKITFALSLPTGAEGLGEWMDLDLAETVPVDDVAGRINEHLPEGLFLLRAWKAPLDTGALNGRVVYMDYKAVLPEPQEGLDALAGAFFERERISIVRVRKGKKKEVDLKNYLVAMRARDDRTLFFTLTLKGEEGSARPAEVLQAMLGLDEESLTRVRLTRTSLTLGLSADKPLSRAGMARIWD